MKTLTTISAALALAGVANAADVQVTADITTSTVWTANNKYELVGQIYVRNGATLTIEAGTVIASNDGGSLAITRGSQIFANGTATDPVIMTSTEDVATWTGGNPKSGQWREGANEWGNLTIMGDAYIAEDAVGANTATPNANNVANMEGLVLQPGQNAQDVQYGGGDDDYDAGTLSYVSLRYGGRVVGLNNELNGLSLGGLGRGTDIHHIEIMNNVDDGIECWGGTVNFKHISIWNVGDDSFDIDQGWRGQAQFGLIVQGFSLDASQGSGVGDNAIEHDGAEDSDYQPVTTGQIYNFTVIGQPVDGDGLTAWRDNARMQYRNCIFMDCGEKVVRFDGDDGDGASGYGHNGTLDWLSTWSTADTVTSTVNAPANPAAFYQAQEGGNLAEISDSVFFRNFNSDAYTEAINVGAVTNGSVGAQANNNVIADLSASPIASIVRHSPQTKGGKIMVRVVKLDPRATNDALVSAGSAPADGFYTPANYRGAFDSTTNWAEGWTAADAYGFFDVTSAQVAQRTSPNNVADSMNLTPAPVLGASVAFTFDPAGNCGVSAGQLYFLYYGLPGAATPLPFFSGCSAFPFGDLLIGLVGSSNLASGAYTGIPGSVPVTLPLAGELCGATLSAQNIYVSLTTFGTTAGNAVDFTFGI
ncbi:hypothetical protein [Engelhardtia mirabilis]|uniref:Uncharacterized protein n=1 Tax=Engelhardtia mirabilis TaxID=2528011 RepID=A0A518BGJ0_9BACT|nr:hypothetical protein Pla133_11510 [Planctomycetes bacterium Pla133]QDV00412.1 hypothetical protein Pla86_11510 [Planctomycetes bacterium Pla86]